MNPLVLALFALLNADPKSPCMIQTGHAPDGSAAWKITCAMMGTPPTAPDTVPDALKPLLAPAPDAAPPPDAPAPAHKQPQDDGDHLFHVRFVW